MGWGGRWLHGLHIRTLMQAGLLALPGAAWDSARSGRMVHDPQIPMLDCLHGLMHRAPSASDGRGCCALPHADAAWAKAVVHPLMLMLLLPPASASAAGVLS